MSDLPPSWRKAKIGWLCNLVNGRAFKPSDWGPIGLPIVRIQNLNNPDAPFNYYDGDVRERFLIDHGQLLFAWSGTPGTSFGAHIWEGQRAILNQHIFKVEIDEELIDKKYLRYAINEKLQELIYKAHGGVGLRHVTKEKFEETEIELPPINEQHRIVAKLDSLFARTRCAREELACIPTLIKHYKEAILAAAFRGELTADWRAHNPGIGQLKAGDLADLISEPIRNGLSLRGSDTPPGIPALRLGALRDICVDMSVVRYLPVDDSDKVRKYFLREGDVLISRGNGTLSLVGLSSLVTKVECPTIFPDTAFRIRLTADAADPRWLAFIWNSPPVRQQVEKLAKTTAGIWKVSQTDISKINLLVPSVIEQCEIVRRIESAWARLDKLMAEQNSTARLIDHLEQALLSEAFQGQLVPQDPNDEPASVLLDRIRAARSPMTNALRVRRRAQQA